MIKQLTAKAEMEGTHIFYVQFEDEGMLRNGTQFWKFAPGINPRAEDVIIPKQAADSFYGTNLAEKLQQLGIEHLVVVGFRTEYCVDTTCRAALSLGYHVTLVEDGYTTHEGELSATQIIKHHNQILANLIVLDRGIEVVPASRVVY
ncbi:isochorismatase family protein [Bacillus sp. REN16]|nr:isochorismatase family protein [Bacillus sp. REN16]